MSLIKYTPFTEFEAFPAGLRVFTDTVNRLFTEPNGRPWVPAVDIKETENDLILKADIPDVDMKDINIQVENGTLTIRGERKFESEKKDGSRRADSEKERLEAGHLGHKGRCWKELRLRIFGWYSTDNNCSK